MTTPGFAAAERAYMEPPDERFGVCVCGCSSEDHDQTGGCETCDDCDGYEPDEHLGEPDPDRAYEEWKEARDEY